MKTIPDQFYEKENAKALKTIADALTILALKQFPYTKEISVATEAAKKRLIESNKGEK